MYLWDMIEGVWFDLNVVLFDYGWRIHVCEVGYIAHIVCEVVWQATTLWTLVSSVEWEVSNTTPTSLAWQA